MDAKPFWASKTLWANLIGLLGGSGLALLSDADVEAWTIVAVTLSNIALRFTTKQPVKVR